MASKMPFCDVKWHQSGSKKNEYRISKGDYNPGAEVDDATITWFPQ